MVLSLINRLKSEINVLFELFHDFFDVIRNAFNSDYTYKIMVYGLGISVLSIALGMLLISIFEDIKWIGLTITLLAINAFFECRFIVKKDYVYYVIDRHTQKFVNVIRNKTHKQIIKTINDKEKLVRFNIDKLKVDEICRDGSIMLECQFKKNGTTIEKTFCMYDFMR